MNSGTERSFYSKDIATFLNENSGNIHGEIHANAVSISPTSQQSDAWKEQIKILKDQFKDYSDAKMIFEYVIPRVGKRVDNIVLLRNIVFILEFKCSTDPSSAKGYPKRALEQVYDYALDLKYFQKESEHRLLVPILVCTKSIGVKNDIDEDDYRIISPLKCNESNIREIVERVIEKYPNEPFLDAERWINSEYYPVPTIIEAAKALYANHSVKDITRHDADIEKMTAEINRIIDFSKENRRKSICFVTGVPGSGKTLVGLNIALSRTEGHGDRATYLSGNGPLVKVLVAALTRDFKERLRSEGRKLDNDAKKEIRGISESIQIVHRYRDEFLDEEKVPQEKIAIFDEAQRAWTEEKIHKFMKTKKKIPDFNQSEPEFLIETMNRHRGWATIICLVGGGQEIYDGEAGIVEWFDSLKRCFKDWDVYVSPELNDSEYCRDRKWEEVISGLNIHARAELNLSASIRSFRTPYLSAFVKSLLDLDTDSAKKYHDKIESNYPIYITRDLDAARDYAKQKSKGTTRYGILASSKAMRLKPSGLFIRSSNDIVNWMLGDSDDVRSSYYLEEPVTEFDIQGLEIDYAIVAWDADLRYVDGKWEYHDFRGSSRMTIHNENNALYLKNAYRVLLTRARQGMVIFIPEGNENDQTRPKQFYDGTYNYLLSLGIRNL